MKMQVIILTVYLLTFPLFCIAEWRISSFNDEMRDITTEVISTESNNKVEFDFPYNGGSSLNLTIRKQNNKLNGIILIISKGQFVCGLYSCKGSVRFDKVGKKGKVEEITLEKSKNGKPNLLFITYEEWFMKKMLNSDSLIIELPFYNHGRRQFTLDITNFPKENI